MAAIKSYTDLEQSKKMAEFLPLESADTYIGNYVGKSGKVDGTNVHYYPKGESFGAPEIINAWSLAALLAAIPIEHNLHSYLTENGMVHRVETLYAGNSKSYDNPIDACYEMIIKLHEQKLL